MLLFRQQAWAGRRSARFAAQAIKVRVDNLGRYAEQLAYPPKETAELWAKVT